MPFIKPLTCAEQVLTERQLEVYLLYGQGKGPTEIGKILFLSRKTISSHRDNIVRKMGFKSTYELTYHAILTSLHGNGKA